MFEFATASKIVFGAGSVKNIGDLAEIYGKKVFIVTGKNTDRAIPVINPLKAGGFQYSVFNIPEEPTTDLIEQGSKLAKQFQTDLVIAIGGGSPVDAGKAIAALVTNRENLFEYLEVIGNAKPLTENPVPFIAVPTTAGTGAEVTKNSVIKCPKNNVKVSLRSPKMIADIALIDPELTYDLPPEITASTGLDALTQLIESYVSNKSNPMTDSLCIEGLKRAACSLEKVYLNGNDKPAREDMCIASLFSGLALANSKLGAVHGIAGPLGGMLPINHGIICARLLPFVMDTNVRALENRDPGSPFLDKYKNIAKILTANPQSQISDGIEWINKLCDLLKVTPLSRLGLDNTVYSELIEKAKRASSMKGNPIELTDDELLAIISKA